MTLRLFNTLGKELQDFVPTNSPILFYSCGPTVYDFIHIGNARAFLFADLLKRYLKFRSFKVKHVMNLTDVDDKTIRRSREENLSLKEYTDKYINAFFEDLDALNVVPANKYPRATECIPAMVKLIQGLLDKGFAYKSGDGIYFSVAKFRDYGKLAGIELAQLQEGASERVKKDEYSKEEAQDFALWKFWDENDGKVFWNTSLGKGRPGWHIECSAMSMKYLAESIDIHTGGVDLVFPHHTNEIAQSECYTKKSFVKYWLHNEHLLVDGKKMSKSLGNFYTVHDILAKGFDGVVLRYALLSVHYRQKINFTMSSLESARNSLNRLWGCVNFLEKANGRENISELVVKTKAAFVEAMDNDLEVSSALAVLFNFVSEVNKLNPSKSSAKKALKLLKEFDSVFGFVLPPKLDVPEEVLELVKQREFARKNKDWTESDKLRARIKELGFLVEDSSGTPVVKKV